MEKSKPESVGISSERLERISKMCEGYVERKEVAGVSVLISRKGETVYRKNIGWADMETKTPIDDSTIFSIFSMTKPISAVAALMLWEQGLFGLDDPVKWYIPAFENPRVFESFEKGDLKTRPAGSDVTIRQLFTMSSGLSYGFTDQGLDTYYHYRFGEMEKNKVKETLANVVDMVGSSPFAFEPGSDFLYGFSIDVLGRIVEILSGKKYQDFLQDEILTPLEMTDTDFYVPEEKAHRLATIYEVKEGTLQRWTDPFNPDYTLPPVFIMPGGGLMSTAEDYAHFCEMLLNKGEYRGKRFLGRKTIDLMSQNDLHGDALNSYRQWGKRGYGYGLGVRTMMDPVAVGLNGSVGEWGWDGMASTWMCIDPAEELYAVFMTQLIPYNAFLLLSRFQQIMYSAIID